METKIGEPKSEAGNPAAPQSSAAPAQAGARRFSMKLFLVLLGVFLVSAPFVQALPDGVFIDGSLLTLVLLSGVLAVGGTRKKLIIAFILAAPAIFGRWYHHFQHDVPGAVFLIPGLVFFVFLIANLLHFILRARHVDSEVLCAGLAAYLLLGMTWMLAYMLVAEFSPTAFVFTAGPVSDHAMTADTAYYFSFITLTTVGYGDIIPVTNIARMLTTVEAVTGTLFMAVMIARLVSLYSTQSPEDPSPKPK